MLGLSRYAMLLIIVLLVATAVRTYDLTSVPPGLNHDEATNAWNAYCILETGRDQAGDDFPIFYSCGLGGYRSTLYYYMLLPFQAIGGLNRTTTRLPSAVSGILAVLLLCFVTSRLFDRRVALWAALLLALSPWHIQQSRWGHEAGPTIFLILVPFAFLAVARNKPAG